MVIGADGRGSGVARRVGAADSARADVSCWYFSYWAASGTGLEMALGPNRRVVFAFPTNDGLLAVFVGWPIDRAAASSAPTSRASCSRPSSWRPELAERVRGGPAGERVLRRDPPAQLRADAVGPGWALVGEPAATRTRYRARRVRCAARRRAARPRRAGDAGLADERPATTRSPATRRGATRRRCPTIHENMADGRPRPFPPEMLEARAAVCGDQEAPTASTWSGRGSSRPTGSPRSRPRPSGAARRAAAPPRARAAPTSSRRVWTATMKVVFAPAPKATASTA